MSELPPAKKKNQPAKQKHILILHFFLKLMISPFLLVGLEILESCLPLFFSVHSVAEVYRINLQNMSHVFLFSLLPLFQASILFLLQSPVGLSKLKIFSAFCTQC